MFVSSKTRRPFTLAVVHSVPRDVPPKGSLTCVPVCFVNRAPQVSMGAGNVDVFVCKGDRHDHGRIAEDVIRNCVICNFSFIYSQQPLDSALTVSK